MKRIVVSLIAVAVMLGFGTAASAQQFEFQQNSKSVFLSGRGTQGEFIFLNAQRSITQVGDGDSGLGTVFIFIGAPVFPPFGRSFFARVPARDIQVDVGDGTASVITTVPGLGQVNVTFQQTGDVTQSQSQFEFEGPGSQFQFSSQVDSRPARGQGTLGPSTIRTTAFGLMSEAELESQPGQ